MKMIHVDNLNDFIQQLIEADREEEEKDEEMNEAGREGDCAFCKLSCAECPFDEEEEMEMDDEEEADDEMRDGIPMAEMPALKLTLPHGYVLRRNSEEPNDWKVVRDPARDPLKPARVIFSKPATIVLWQDGTKTIVKCDKKDRYSKATGLALCYMKKALGNTSRGLNDALREAKDCAVEESGKDRKPSKKDKALPDERKSIYTGHSLVKENRK